MHLPSRSSTHTDAGACQQNEHDPSVAGDISRGRDQRFGTHVSGSRISTRPLTFRLLLPVRCTTQHLHTQARCKGKRTWSLDQSYGWIRRRRFEHRRAKPIRPSIKYGTWGEASYDGAGNIAPILKVEPSPTLTPTVSALAAVTINS